MEKLRAVFRKLSVLLSLLTAVVLFSAESMPPREYQIKAVFLYNFAKFIEWPQTSFEPSNAPLVIGILGEDPFGNFLDNTIKDEIVSGHPMVVKRYGNINEISACHILFIGKKTKGKPADIISKLNSKSVLTVGEAEEFINYGGIVRFFLDEGKIRMQINLDAAKGADIKISSKLLSVADIVKVK